MSDFSDSAEDSGRRPGLGAWPGAG